MCGSPRWLKLRNNVSEQLWDKLIVSVNKSVLDNFAQETRKPNVIHFTPREIRESMYETIY